MSNDSRPLSLKDFSERLRAARENQEQATREIRGPSRQYGLAYRVAIEMAAGLAVGAGLGWALDRWLGTRPVFLVVLGLMGFAAGVLNAWRAAQAAERAAQGEDRRG
jgi:ATP synthase protein I